MKNLKNITDEAFEDLVCTGLWGINYWGAVSEKSIKRAISFTGNEEVEVAVAKYLLQGGMALVRSMGEGNFWLSADKLRNAEIDDDLYDNIVSGQYDADDADVLIQIALFNEIVYA